MDSFVKTQKAVWVKWLQDTDQPASRNFLPSTGKSYMPWVGFLKGTNVCNLLVNAIPVDTLRRFRILFLSFYVRFIKIKTFVSAKKCS